MVGDLHIPLEAWRVRGSSFSYRGHDVFYLDEGAGDAVVLIHGFPTASWDWAWVWSSLADRYRAIAPDMMGFGFSAKPTNYEYSLFDQADLYEALLEKIGVARAHFLCHDYGDTVGQELLARMSEGRLPFKIRSMCFLNGGIIPGEHRPRLIQRLLIGPLGPVVARFMLESRFHTSFAALFGSNSQPTPDELHDFWSLVECNDGRRIVHKLIRYMRERVEHKDRWIGALVDSRVPLRFINGPEDPVAGRHMAETYARLVPKPDVVYLNDIGHYPQVEAPESTLLAFLEFIAAVEAGE